MSRQIPMSFTFNSQGVNIKSFSGNAGNLQFNQLNLKQRLQLVKLQEINQEKIKKLKNMNILKSNGGGCGCG